MVAAAAPGAGEAFLAADVGGTHARIGLVIGDAAGKRPVSVLHYHRYGCADWSSLAAMLQDFVEQLAEHAARRAARPVASLRGGLCRLRAGRRDHQREPAVAGIDP